MSKCRSRSTSTPWPVAACAFTPACCNCRAVERLCRIRERGRELGMQKLPATSELVDWVRVLHWQKRKAEAVSVDALDAVDQAVLFKIRQDIERYRARTDDEAGR